MGGLRRREPPSDSNSVFCQGNVPSWEKEFCASSGVPWMKVMEAKKCTGCHPRVLNWNDSAGEESFLNAKQRYWEKINGLPCTIFLPDPDIYLTEVDWNDSHTYADITDFQVFSYVIKKHRTEGNCPGACKDNSWVILNRGTEHVNRLKNWEHSSKCHSV